MTPHLTVQCNGRQIHIKMFTREIKFCADHVSRHRTANAVDRMIPRELSDALLAEIDRGGLPFTAQQERMLRERLAQPSAPLPTVQAVPR